MLVTLVLEQAFGAYYCILQNPTGSLDIKRGDISYRFFRPPVLGPSSEIQAFGKMGSGFKMWALRLGG